MSATHEPARVYIVSGASSTSATDASYNSSSLPDILRRSGSSNKRKKRKGAIENDKILSKIELIQDFEFPEASNKIRFTRDGRNIMASGTYKPQIRLWDCEQLSLKFERHTDAENVDFVLLSDDWTKSLHLQSDRSLELHAQGGTHTRVRLPRFGRTLNYHFPSADALVGASGNEVYRVNLSQGRFLASYVLGSHGNLVTGCNAIDVNPAHGLLSFGTEGNGIVELWDPRMRHQAGALSIATSTLMDTALLAARRQLPGVGVHDDEEGDVVRASESLAVTALASSEDGLNMAVGTSTGHVLLFDLRMDKPYMTKDQGFGLPVHSLSWPGDHGAALAAGNMGADAHARSESLGTVLSADAKVIKIWERDTGDNVVSIAPPAATANLNNVQHYPGSGLIFSTAEATQMVAWYVPALGPAPKWCSFIDNITDEIESSDAAGVGGATNAYEDFKFVDQAELERLDLAHLVGSPLLRPYMHGYFISLKLYERARLLAHPHAYAEAKQRAIQSKLEREAESRVRATKAPQLGKNIQVNRKLATKFATAQPGKKAAQDTSDILEDTRFKELFTNPEFEVDETSREYALLNPSASAAPKPALRESERKLVPAMEEALESDTESLDPDQKEMESSSEEEAPAPPPVRASKAVPRNAHSAPRLVDERGASEGTDMMSLGERARLHTHASAHTQPQSAMAGAMSFSFTPSGASDEPKKTKRTKKPAQDTFGAGLSKGAGAEQGYGVEALDEQARFGRKQRRKPGRSASKNVMRANSAN
ncbi:Small ribosomal subunit biogenesis [Malassezia vespertilionis]|uniref:Uncharacterized protein n=1 Tax=Malassezia vespertilionis TaxID=2020962 RepID=A0A2N1JAS3_9BASI|nr:Small ribosomal subunit biogenesis [Malassezia vespertilionis]PKI83649.1 hypothetical protein MVES_002614 [Malassezia vespertilionis]WFD07401.1 Small ribosomal subunit biogenesis [Malassezia vespertilionis]